jgi:hypothetical protein
MEKYRFIEASVVLESQHYTQVIQERCLFCHCFSCSPDCTYFLACPASDATCAESRPETTATPMVLNVSAQAPVAHSAVSGPQASGSPFRRCAPTLLAVLAAALIAALAAIPPAPQ